MLLKRFAALVLLALVVVAFQRFGPSGAQGRLLSYRVVDDRTVEVRFEVTTDPGTTPTCVIQALAADMSEVGAEEVRIGPSLEDRVVQTRTLVTSRRAVAAKVVTCRL